jgi:hypothetical protein
VVRTGSSRFDTLVNSEEIATRIAMMAGTLQLSRALADRKLSDEILQQGNHNVLALLDTQS